MCHADDSCLLPFLIKTNFSIVTQSFEFRTKIVVQLSVEVSKPMAFNSLFDVDATTYRHPNRNRSWAIKILANEILMGEGYWLPWQTDIKLRTLKLTWFSDSNGETPAASRKPLSLVIINSIDMSPSLQRSTRRCWRLQVFRNKSVRNWITRNWWCAAVGWFRCENNLMSVPALDKSSAEQK